MKASRSYLLVIGLLMGALCFSNLISLSGYFQAVESSGSGVYSEKRLLAQMQQLHDRLVQTDDSEEAKQLLRSFENTFGIGTKGDAQEKWKKSYAGVLALFVGKPKEADSRSILIKKREFMEALVNAYRKEIPNGPIPVRAAYLNILFDTQNSLLNQSAESEEVYLRRTKERLGALKVTASASGDQGLLPRVGGLESVFLAFERGFELTEKWKKEKTTALGTVAKSLPVLARDALGSQDSQLEGTRRSFLYASIFAIVVGLLAFGVLFVCHKMLKLRFFTRTDALLRVLKSFGRERADATHEKDLALLSGDAEWAEIAHGAVESETEFVSHYQALLAVPNSLQTPFVVFSAERVAKYWSPAAGEVLRLRGEGAISLDEVIRPEQFVDREGSGAVVETIRQSFTATKESVFEVLVDGEPYELLSYPIYSGPLVGGKLFLLRGIRNETNRINQAVSAQLARVRECVRLIADNQPTEGVNTGNDAQEVKDAVSDLLAMKRKNDERDALWKSETGALLDQIHRQRTILERSAGEIKQIRESQTEALQLMGSVQSGDQDWHGEIRVLNKEMEQWKSLRQRLESDLNQHAQVLDHARSFEQKVRVSAEEMEGFLSGYELILDELRSFSDEARLQAVNLGFSSDSGQRDFAARCRAYAHELGKFVEHASRLSTRMHGFLQEHPATALAPHLDSADIDPALLAGLKLEEERLARFVGRWLGDGDGIVAEGQRALELLRMADKRSSLVDQLGETILLINDQAKSNLERWS